MRRIGVETLAPALAEAEEELLRMASRLPSPPAPLRKAAARLRTARGALRRPGQPEP